jgi:hypothetical protein
MEVVVVVGLTVVVVDVGITEDVVVDGGLIVVVEVVATEPAGIIEINL